MSNEETTIMQPNNNEKANATTDNKKQGKGVNGAAIAGAAVAGGVLGSGATYAATSMFNGSEEEEPKEQEQEQQEVQAAEEPAKPADTKTEEKPQEVEAKEEPAPVAAEPEEIDYTGLNGANPQSDAPAHTTTASNDSEGNDVQVLGVYEAQGEYGQTMHAAVLTDGHEVAAVVDVDGDNQADLLAVDSNHNQQIDEGEVYDISDQNIQMEPIEQVYIAQQQEQMQQEQMQQDTFAYSASDEHQDYNNDADLPIA
jgi:hypothetical protein